MEIGASGCIAPGCSGANTQHGGKPHRATRKSNYTVGGWIVVDGSRRRAYALLRIWLNQCGDPLSSVFGPELKRVWREGAIDSLHFGLWFHPICVASLIL
jgi:hypothetical protein